MYPIRCLATFGERHTRPHRGESRELHEHQGNRARGCGVHFLRTRKSSLLFGVGEDATVVARSIAAD